MAAIVVAVLALALMCVLDHAHRIASCPGRTGVTVGSIVYCRDDKTMIMYPALEQSR